MLIIVFDLHHHLAHHKQPNWQDEWERVVRTWQHSPLPIKMHISSPKSVQHFRLHADYIDVDMFMDFLQAIGGRKYIRKKSRFIEVFVDLSCNLGKED